MKPLMTEKQLDAKIARLEKNERMQCKRKLTLELKKPKTERSDYTIRHCQRGIAKPLLNIFYLPYKKRKKYFNNNRNCSFNPLTGNGDSYCWYALTKVIKGKLVLNTYHYSQQTSGHIYDVTNVMEKLGLKFIRVDAPRGLQDLESARQHIAYKYESELLRLKHARKPYFGTLNSYKKQFKVLKQLGFPITQKLLKNKAAEVLTERNARLANAKAKRDEVKRVKIEFTPKMSDLSAITI